jgi:hypothetical protein
MKQATNARLTRTTLTLNADSSTDDLTAERITLHEVQRIVDDFNSQQSDILVTFNGPFVVSANIVVRLEPANRVMNEDEIRIFEAAFLNVVNPPADGVVISSAKVYYQQLTSQNRRRLHSPPRMTFSFVLMDNVKTALLLGMDC